MSTKKSKPVKRRAKAIPATAMDKQWQTESDLRTLIEAEKIKTDRRRLSAAQSFAQKQAALAAKVGKL